MNDQRRRRIRLAAKAAKAVYDELDELYNEEEEAFENLPESLQDGERGEAMQDAMNELDTARGTAEMLVDEIMASIGESADDLPD